ncbi:MAG: efflux RND transporter permease subunit, partial [Bacteroidales bacterium]
MNDNPQKKKTTTRTFSITNGALKNKNTIFLLTLLLAVFGIFSYRTLPKELFPDVVIPIIMVQTVYPGNPPVDIENLITRPLENEINTITGIEELSSTSSQDNSSIFVEFETDIDIKVALQDVKDAVDRVRGDLPDDLPADPMVMDIDFSEFPIVNVNLSGDFSLNELKRFADYLEEEFEAIPEISKIEITGIDEREVQINVNPLVMDSYQISFTDIENAIAQENISIAGGSVLFEDSTRWAVRTIGEFSQVRQLEDIVVKQEGGNIVYLRDLAEIAETYTYPESFARLDEEPVVSLQVVKKSGENLLSATAKIFSVLEEARSSQAIPPDLNVTITNDQSEEIRNQLSNLENSVILAVILVILVLYFFLGLKNALFVGIAIPMSMVMSFMVFGLAGIQINMIVLFSLILALGLLVDNAIVAVDNIFRHVEQGYPVLQAARIGIGEIAWPIITSTATTLSAFLPLAFWTGIVGEFMKYLPITLIIVLSSSLFVALVIVPVFSESFFSKQQEGGKTKRQINRKARNRNMLILIATLIAAGVALHLMQVVLYGNIMILLAGLLFLGYFVFRNLEGLFQEKILPFNERIYSKTLHFALRGKNPYLFVGGTLLFLLFSVGFFVVRSPKVLFFPESDPQYINIIAELPVGTDIVKTDERVREIEHHVEQILEPYRHIVKSVLTTVGKGAVAEMEMSTGDTPNRGRITVTFTEYEQRGELSTSGIMSEISDALLGEYPGVEFNISQNQTGPPTGEPINIEISGREFERLIQLTGRIQQRVEASGIEGIEALAMDLDVDKPEIIVNIDRDMARRFGISTYAIANTIRTALFGREVSNFKIGEEEWPIQLRLQEEYRNDLSSLLNQRITFRSASTGRIMQVPISSVASVEYSKTYGAVNRIDLKRVITLSSNVLPGYNANEINQQLRELLERMDLPEGYAYAFTGEQQQQQESMDFLITAMI